MNESLGCKLAPDTLMEPSHTEMPQDAMGFHWVLPDRLAAAAKLPGFFHRPTFEVVETKGREQTEHRKKYPTPVSSRWVLSESEAPLSWRLLMQLLML